MPPNLLIYVVLMALARLDYCGCEEIVPKIPPPSPSVDDRIAQLRQQLETSEMVAQIHGSIQQFSETARIRQQLNEAIQEDYYARPAVYPAPPVNVDPYTAPPPDDSNEANDYYNTVAPPLAPFFPKFDLIKFLLGQAEQNPDLHPIFPQNDDAASLGAAMTPNANAEDTLSHFIRTSFAEAIKAPGNEQLAALNRTGLVDHLLMADGGGEASVSKNQLRETLELVSVTEDTGFTLGSNVNAWHVLQNSAGNAVMHGLIGITDDATVILVIEQNGTYQRVHEINVGTSGPVLASQTFVQWSAAASQLNAYVIVAVPGELLFIAADTHHGRLRIAWRWAIVRQVTALLHFQIDGYGDILLMATANARHAGNDTTEAVAYSADLYHFDVSEQHTWLTQKIAVPVALRSVQYMEVGRDSLLVYALNGTVEMMRREYDGVGAPQQHRFVHFKTIDAPHVTTVACFQIGGLAYVALGGSRPQILRYHRGDFYAQTILASSWGVVELFLAIPARTYRDDLIVLVQHRVQIDGGRVAPVLDALIWNGLAFETAALAVPCWLNGVRIREGVTCVLDELRDAGLRGANVLQRGTNIALLVPREHAPSGLFTLTFRLDAVQSPALLQAQTPYRHGDLLQRLNGQTDVISDAELALLNAVDEGGDREVTGDWNVERMMVAELVIDDVEQLLYKEFRFGEVLWTAEDSAVDLDSMWAALDASRLELADLEQQLNSPAMRVTLPSNGHFTTDRLRVLPHRKRRQGDRAVAGDGAEPMRAMRVEHLQAEFINGRSVEEFVFVDETGALDLGDSDVYLDSDDVQVTNGVEIIGAGRAEDNPADVGLVESIDGNMQIAGDLNVGTINGRDFQDLMQNIVLVNVPNTLDVVEVAGNVTFRNELNVAKVNEFAFPGDFLWNSEHFGDVSTIYGHKEFAYRVGAIEVDIFGQHNNITPQDVVTLSGDQTLLGHTTFQGLLVTKALNITGRISGPHMDHILSNPSILQTNFIQSDCHFQQLIVNGPIYIEDTLNEFNLDAALQDVVYKSDDRTRIESAKTFVQLQAPELQLGSARINDVPLDDIMTLDTPQTLRLDTLSGNVIFRDLRIDGLFDFVNVTELDENSIKLSGDQYTEAALQFESEFAAQHLDVLTTLNDIPLDTLAPLNQPLTIGGTLHIDGAMITNLDLPNGRLIGMGTLAGQDLNVFNATRLSRSRSQHIFETYFVRSLRIAGNLEASTVNGVAVSAVRQLVESTPNGPGYLADGSTRITRLTIDGDVQVTHLNGHDLAVIMSNAVWLDRPNRIESVIAFADAAEIIGGLQTATMNAVPLDDFVAGMVQRDRLDGLAFGAEQTFARAPAGLRQIDANRIGDVAAAAIFSKKTDRVKTLHVIGDVDVDAVNVAGTFNGTDVKEIAALYVFDELSGAHVLRHPNVRFSRDAGMGALWLHQRSPNVSQFLASVVPKNADGLVLMGPKIFDGRVTFKEDVLIEYGNGVHFPAVLDAMVMNEIGAEFFVNGDVSFEGGLAASNVAIDGDIAAGTIMGCDWREWLANGVRIDRPVTLANSLEFDAQSLKCDNIQAQYINAVAVEGLITMHSEQHFVGSTHFSNVLSNGDVTVGGLVNGVDLRQEQENTLKISGDQIITAPTNFQSIRVLNTVYTEDTVNGIDLRSIVALDQNASLAGSFAFSALEASDMQTDDLLSGIDFTHWTQNTLLHNASEPQTVTGNWTIQQMLVANIDGSDRLNGASIGALSERLQQHTGDLLGGAAAETQQTVHGVCNEMRQLIERSQRFHYGIAHFEELLRIAAGAGAGDADAAVRSVHVFEWNRSVFLLLNVGCVTRVFKWNAVSGVFRNKGDLNTGPVDEWITLSSTSEPKVLHWATNTIPDASTECAHSGLNLWKIVGTKIVLVKNIGASGAFRLNAASAPTMDTFYAIDDRANTVAEFDLEGNAVEVWKLPSTVIALQNEQQPLQSEFVFLPPQINFGLALSDGTRLCTLTSTAGNATKLRAKRFFMKELFDPAQSRLRTDKRERMETDSVVGAARKHAGLFTNASAVPDMKLKMFRSDANGTPIPWPSPMRRCNITWPACKLGWWNQSPEEAKVLTANSNATVPNLQAARIDIFGRIEKEAKKLADAAMERFIGHPTGHGSESEGRSATESTTDELTTSAPSSADSDGELYSTIATTSAAVNVEHATESSTWTTIAPMLADNIVVGAEQSNTTESTTLSPTMSAKSGNVSSYRTDTFGRIEANSKVLLDNIMDNRYGAPNDPNQHNFDAEDDDEDGTEDDDDYITETPLMLISPSLNAALFNVPRELQSELPANNGTAELGAGLNQTAQTTDGPPDDGEGGPQVGGIFDVLRNVGIAVHEGREVLAELRENIHQQNSKLAAEAAKSPKINTTNDDVDEEPKHHNAGHDVPLVEKTDDSLPTPDNSSDVGDVDAVQLTHEDSTDASVVEPEIGVPVLTSSGVATTANAYLPGRRAGAELLALEVGTNYRRLLVAVSEWSGDTVKGRQDYIRIYEDIMDGHIFQTISCHRPRSLTTLRMGTDTALAFVERDAEVRVFVYRGIEGFVPLAAFTLPEPVQRLQAVVLPGRDAHQCWRHAIVVSLAHEARLAEVIGRGYCGMQAALICN